MASSLSFVSAVDAVAAELQQCRSSRSGRSSRVVVIGGGAGGLAAGARLARHGMDVVLLEKNDNVGGRMQSVEWTRGSGESYRFDTGPSLLLLPQQYKETFASLGDDIDHYVSFKRVEPAAYRVFFADQQFPRSLDLLYDVQQMCSQLETVERGSSAAYIRFLSNAKECLDKGVEHFIAKDFRSFWDYANVSSLLPLLKRLSPLDLLGQHHAVMRSYFTNPKLCALFTFQDLYVGLTPYSAPAVFSLLAATELIDGVWYPLGGFGKIRDGLASAARKAGLNIRSTTTVQCINVHDGKVMGVTLADGTTVEADIVVANADLPYVYSDLLPLEGPLRQRSNFVSSSKYSAGVIAFNWALSTRLRGISHHNIFLSDLYKRSWERATSSKSLIQRPNFYLHAPSRTDPTAAPEGGDAVTVLVPVANLSEGYDEDNDRKMVDAARRAVFQTLESAGVGEVQPFILHESVSSPSGWRSTYNLKHGAAFGLSHNFFQLGYFRPSIADPQIEGLYFVGASTRPGNGVPLVLMGAKLTSTRILEDYNVKSTARFEATVLYAPGDGIGGSVLVSAPNAAAQYLFNVPEGFSRLALEHKIRPSGRLACVLLGSIRPECAGGVGGLILRLAQDGHGQLQLFGPAGTEQYVHSLRHIFHWRHPKVFACEFEVNKGTPVFEDSYVVIVPLVADDGQTQACCVCCSQGETASREPDGRSTSTAAVTQQVKRTGNEEGMGKQRFRWTVSNAKRDAVPEPEEGANPVYSVDPSGDVSGIERTKTSVSATTCLGYLLYMKVLKTGLLLVDFRNPAAVSRLLVHPALRCPLHQAQVVGAVVYLSPESAQLRERLQQKYPGVHHIRLADGGGFQAPLETAAKLNLVDEKLFPLPLQCDGEFDEMSCRLLSRLIFERQASGFGVRLDHSMCGDRFNFKHFQDDFLQSRPEVKEQLMNRSHNFIQGTERPSSNQVAAAAMRQKLSNHKEMLQVPPPKLISRENDFELLFLGTGCAEPSKYRGSSGILLRLLGGSSLLLDAGEGSVGQLQRRLGRDGAFRALASLRCLWLSHKHADHVLGTVSVIWSRQQENSRLVVVGPSKVGDWLTEVKNACAMAGCSLPDFEFLHFEEFNALQRTAAQEPSLLEQLQLRSMISVPVHHCYDAYGVVIFGRREWSVVYSGDSRPCERLIQAGAGCTLLIHEATFEDSLKDHARAKRHSTVPEALQVGHRMQAEQVILTHFSQRYAKVVDIDSSRYENACMAFDGMFVASSRLSCLRQLLPLLKLVLSERRRARQGKHEAAAASGADVPACKRQAAICVPSIVQELPVSKRQHIRWLDSDIED